MHPLLPKGLEFSKREERGWKVGQVNEEVRRNSKGRVGWTSSLKYHPACLCAVGDSSVENKAIHGACVWRALLSFVRMNRFANRRLSVFSRRSTTDGQLVLVTTTMVGAIRLLCMWFVLKRYQGAVKIDCATVLWSVDRLCGGGRIKCGYASFLRTIVRYLGDLVNVI